MLSLGDVEHPGCYKAAGVLRNRLTTEKMTRLLAFLKTAGMSTTQLQQAAADLAERLRATGKRVVFAESCTAGLIAATMGEIPGISEHVCGSAVVYRNATKAAWLDVSAADLADPSIGAVSAQVAAAMATGVLGQTCEADIAASITGHLGPNAPPTADGLTYVGIAVRNTESEVQLISVDEVRLSSHAPADSPLSLRQWRQQAAATHVLDLVTQTVETRLWS